MGAKNDEARIGGALVRYVALILAFLLPLGCYAQSSGFNPSDPHLNKNQTSKWLSSQHDGAVFVSRGGKMYGMDSDAKVILRSKGQAEVLEYGFVGRKYSGTYRVEDSGAIHLELKKYRGEWPDMYLYKVSSGIYLFPTDMDQQFRMGGRAGATETPKMAPYWPFKKLK